MGLADHRDSFGIALDSAAELETRISAIEELGSSGSRVAVQALLELGARATENLQILRAAGTALGALDNSGVNVSEFDMRNIQGATYDAFCDYQA